jgi:3-oxoacyl-[acyl-carrier-protein] synthase III
MVVHIVSTGGKLPSKVVLNSEIEEKLFLQPGWIKQRCGIERRHILEEEVFLDMAVQAADQAIASKGIEANAIDLIILATTTPQQIMPSSAVLIQGELEIEQCIAFDIQAACSGFVYALSIAESLMCSEQIRYALVLGCDAFSKIVNHADPSTETIFGDGFGAVLLENSIEREARGIFYKQISADGKGSAHLEVPWGLAKGFYSLEQVSPHVQMKGNEVFKQAVHHFSHQIKSALEGSNTPIDWVDHIITHQANKRIIDEVGLHLDIPMEKFVVTLVHHGNTSAASIPLALHHISQQGLLNVAKTVLMTGFGAGYTWGTVMAEVDFSEGYANA